MRGDCSFCYYRLKCLPSLFKLPHSWQEISYFTCGYFGW